MSVKERQMTAKFIYQFYLGPYESDSVFIHGYANNQAVVYSAIVTPHPQPGGIYPPPPALGMMNMTQGETYRHVDDTVARKVYVQNLATANWCTIDIIEISETV
jgi:hypothetical protein